MGGAEWGGGGDTEIITVSQTVKKKGKIQNSSHLHNVKHVVQSTIENT